MDALRRGEGEGVEEGEVGAEVAAEGSNRESDEEEGSEMEVDGEAERGRGRGKGRGAGRRAGLEGEREAEREGEEEEGEEGEGAGEVDRATVEMDNRAGMVVARVEGLSLVDEVPDADQATRMREEVRKRLRRGQGEVGGDVDLDRGRQVWSRAEALTSALSADLAEQLRLLLEPMVASRLAGDYRTGKRLNMRRVVPYVASGFRRDRIWMRRTRPDRRAYQVVLAVDDSRSMAESGCGAFAVEALALVVRALARLEAGEVGVVSFGGAGSARALHPLGSPFTDDAGARVVAQLGFDQDNTIADRPVADLLAFLDATLEDAALRAAPAGTDPASLRQLVLVLADGRFHEKEALRRAVRDLCDRRGVLLAFLSLDAARPGDSLLDLQSVAFRGGQPVFARYLDSFPFPYYVLLRDIAQLPGTLSDLVRQWFALRG